VPQNSFVLKNDETGFQACPDRLGQKMKNNIGGIGVFGCFGVLFTARLSFY
jgi:hypothetical protein